MDNSRRFYEILDPDQVHEISETAMRVLEDVGLWLPSQEALSLFSDVGANVDFKNQQVRIPPHIVEAAMRQAPPRLTWHARNPSLSLDVNGLTTYFGSPESAIRVIDLEGIRRPGTQQDGEEICRLCDALPNLSVTGTGVEPAGMPIDVLETWYTMVMFTNSSKPINAGIHSAPYAISMAEVVADSCGLDRDQLPLATTLNPHSPLYNVPDQLEGMFAYARRKVPIIIAPEVQAGATGPSTLAGVMVQATAEFLAHAVLCQLISPGLPIMYGCVSSVFDMRKMMLPYGAPEMDLLTIATAQMARYYDIPSRGTGGCSDANALGVQAGIESLMSTLLPLLAGVDYVMHGAGELENSLTVSYEKVVIDDEIIAMARRCVQGIEVTSETLAFEVIRAVGPRGDFLGTEHTLRHFRKEQFLPTLLTRDKYDIWQEAGGKRMEEHARDQAQVLLGSHEPEPLPEEAVQELDAIYASAMRTANLDLD